MIKLSLNELQNILQKASEQGCNQVKLQLYDSWDEIVKEQRTPSLPVEDYKFDSRFYNTVEFRSEIENDVATDRIMTRIEDKLLVVHVEISDSETLMKGFGLEEE